MIDRLDAFQRRHTWLGFPIAVGYKIFDDRGPYLAALIAYYGFVSLFPLLLLFFSGVGYVLHGDHGLQHRLAHSALRYFPIVGPQLRSNISSFAGNGTALAVGIVGSLYGGLGIMQAAQTAFNTIYAVPRNEQPNAFKARLRSLALLGLLGGGIVSTSALTIFVTTAQSLGGATIGLWLKVVGVLLSFVLNTALFSAAFQLLTAHDLRLRHVVHGGLLAAAGWQLLQAEGSRYLAHRLDHANEVYGSFALVLALVAYIYLDALLVVVAAEINVVLNHGLWPRALLTPFTDRVELTDADRRLYRWYAGRERFKGFETIRADFGEGDDERVAEAPKAPGAAEPAADEPVTRETADAEASSRSRS